MNIDYHEVINFAQRNVAWLVIALVALFLSFTINSKLADIRGYSQRTYLAVDQSLKSGVSELQVQALVEKAEEKQAEATRISLLATAIKSIIAGVCALLIMSITAYSFTKLDFSDGKSNQVLAYIALGAFILVGLVFASENAKTQTPSDISINCIKSFEGFRAKPYQDAVGVWTDGWGNTRNVVPNRYKSKTEATLDLVNHLMRFDKSLKSRITRRLPQHEYDALISFVYNLGGGVIKGQLQRDINYGLADLVAYRMKLYVKAGGRTLNGLVRRREVEAKIYLKDCQFIRKFTPYYARCT